MGSKKRSSGSMEDVDNVEKNDANDVVSDPVKKKVKKDKGKDVSDGIPQSIKPMERKKKRKALDKERHRVALENEKSKGKESDADKKESDTRVQGGDVASASSSGSSGLPEFHIGVFKDLASADVSVREAAVEQLVSELREVQKAYEMLENKESVEGSLKLEAEKDDGLNNCAPSLRYAVRRLVRGVSSSRECARQGFALALTVLVGTVHSIRVTSLLKLTSDMLEVAASMKGQEMRDCLLGRLFAYGAVARSGRLTKEWALDKSTSAIKEFVNDLISLAAKKQYLQEPAIAVIIDVLEKLPNEAILGHVLESPGVQEWFRKASDVGKTDALLLALKIREKLPNESIELGNLLPNPFNPRKLFSVDHLYSLVNCLKESTFCQPRVHSVWPTLVNLLLPEAIPQAEDIESASNSLKRHRKGRKSSSSEEETTKSVRNFCEIIIEGSLIQSSHDRKRLAFDVLLLIMQRLPASLLPFVMSYKIVQGLMDILSTKSTWLYKVAQHFLKELSNWVGNDDVRRVAVVVALQKHSNGKFDVITKTKTVKTLMTHINTESGGMLFIQNLLNLFLDEDHASEEPSDQSQTTDDNSELGSGEDIASGSGNTDSLKIWIVEALPSILKNLKLEPEAKIRLQKEVLKILTVQGLFSASLGTEVTSFELQERFKWPRVATSNNICRTCVQQIQSLLASAFKTERRTPNLEPNDHGSYFMRFLSTLRNIPSVSLFRSLDEEEDKAFKKFQEIDSWLLREERNNDLADPITASRMHGLRYLLIQLVLQMLLEGREALEALSDLIVCCKKIFAISDILVDSGEDEMDIDENLNAIDVLIDTLLSLLPQSSAPLRSAIEQVFRFFCEDLTSDELLRVLRIIKKDLKPTRHPGGDTDGDDEEDDEAEDFLGVEEDEDDEIDEAETGETGESEGQTDDSEAINEVGEADEEPSESENSDDSEGMDDDAMFRMDTYLAKIFKEKKNQAGGETAQSQLVLFKLRVLSLVETYLQECPGHSLVLTIYKYLAQALVNPHTVEVSEQLGQRIWGILQKQIFKAKEIPKSEGIELPKLKSLLEKNLKLASKPFKSKVTSGNPSKKKQSGAWKRHEMIVSLGQNSTFWILKIIDATNYPESELQTVVDVFKDAIAGYFDSKKSQIKSGFIREVFRRRPWLGHQLLGFILEKCSSTALEYRRIEALEIVLEILKSLVCSGVDESKRSASKKIVRSHVQELAYVVEALVRRKLKKQSRVGEVRKFCNKVFQIVLSHELTRAFLKELTAEGEAACESQLGDAFVSLKKV